MLLAQFHPLEEALAAMGVAVWPMVELEADDGLASAANRCGRRASRKSPSGRPTKISPNASAATEWSKWIAKVKRFGTRKVCARNSASSQR